MFTAAHSTYNCHPSIHVASPLKFNSATFEGPVLLILFHLLQRKQNGDLHATVRSSNPKYRQCCGPICWALLAFKSLIGKIKTFFEAVTCRPVCCLEEF
jgi:hypothetical protein